MAYVDKTFPMLSREAIYVHDANGVRRLHPSCRKAIYQNIKNNYKRRHVS